MDNTISRTCGFVRRSLAAPAQLATVVSEAAVTTHLRPIGRGGNREEVAATASVKAGRTGVATSPRRASGLTSSGSFVTRQLVEPSQEEIANEHGFVHVCILRQRTTLGTVGLAAV